MNLEKVSAGFCSWVGCTVSAGLVLARDLLILEDILRYSNDIIGTGTLSHSSGASPYPSASPPTPMYVRMCTMYNDTHPLPLPLMARDGMCYCK